MSGRAYSSSVSARDCVCVCLWREGASVVNSWPVSRVPLCDPELADRQEEIGGVDGSGNKAGAPGCGRVSRHVAHGAVGELVQV